MMHSLTVSPSSISHFSIAQSVSLSGFAKKSRKINSLLVLQQLQCSYKEDITDCIYI